MGMYCCCDQKISSDNFKCRCNWKAWISTCDWPPERKNKKIPISLPPKDGKYMVRIQNNSGDRYEDEIFFSLIPKIEKGGYSTPIEIEIHWEGENWEEGRPYAWKEID